MKTINTLDIAPFKRLVMTIGELPTSFIESMSYYEALAWLVNYIENTVVPTVNNNAEATKELQEAFTLLKDYVDNYFDNLDVQDEINNKLDEMAESGELVDIIAQYLGLAGILVYNTIADMSAAQNLTDGSVARTLGKTDYTTGDGSFYKIRQIRNTDVIDGVDIVAITDNPELVAERIPHYYEDQLQEQVNTIDENIGNLDELTTANKSSLVNAINETNLNLKNFVSQTITYPLLVGKKSDGNNDGSTQGLCVKYGSNGLPAKIFQWYDYTSYAKLYVTTCGSRTDGSGWSTTVLNSANNEIPYTHGSTITYNPDLDKVICGLPDAKLGIIDYTNHSYTEQSLSDLGFSNEVLGVSYDPITENYNICFINTKHFIIDKDFTEIIREYEYTANDYPDYTSYGFQGYAFYNDLEYRAMSSNYNMIMIFNTYTGKLIKTISPNGIFGELESIAVNENTALLQFNNTDDYCGLLYHHYVAECFLGGFPTADIKKLQDYRVIGADVSKLSIIPQTNIANYTLTLYYANNYSDSDVIRYVGTGTSSNPIKSGSAMGTFLGIINGIANTSADVTISINSSSNHDDNGFYINGYAKLNPVFTFTNGASVSILRCQRSGSVEIFDAKINSSGTTRRNNGSLEISRNKSFLAHNANTCQLMNIELNPLVGIYDTGIDSLATSGTTIFRRNVSFNSSAQLTARITNSGGATLSMFDNVTSA